MLDGFLPDGPVPWYLYSQGFLPVQSHGSRGTQMFDAGFLALLLDCAKAQNRNAEAQVVSRLRNVLGNRITHRLCLSCISHRIKMGAVI